MISGSFRVTSERVGFKILYPCSRAVARAAAAETLADVKKAMKINYFDDKELIEEQVKRFSQE